MLERGATERHVMRAAQTASDLSFEAMSTKRYLGDQRPYVRSFAPLRMTIPFCELSYSIPRARMAPFGSPGFWQPLLVCQSRRLHHPQGPLPVRDQRYNPP